MEEQVQQYLTHENPVWRDKADFIIHGKVDSGDNILRLVLRGVNTPTDLAIDNKKIIYGSEIQPMRYENARTQSSSDHTNR